MEPRPDWLWDVLVPVAQWAGAALVAVALAYWLAGVLRHMDEVDVPGRRECPNCGYDVRATPEICPECGHVLPPLEDEEAQTSAESVMPIYTIPPGAGPFTVVQGPDKSFAVAEARAVGDPATAAKLGFIFIPCRDEQQAVALAEKLNRGKHDGTVQVDLLDVPGARPSAGGSE